MVKKKHISRYLLNFLLNYVTSCVFSLLFTYRDKTSILDKYFFRLTHRTRQFVFSMNNLILTFIKVLSTGSILYDFLKKFKFFKRSIFNFNPLIFRLKTKYSKVFNNVYICESLNYSKKHYIFLKKLISDPIVIIKYFIVNKA